MVPTTAQMHELGTSIWTTMLGVDASPRPGVSAEPASPERMTACVHITGGWSGAVTLECSRRLAREAAALMFDAEAAALDPAEIEDALGELANVAGGNVKALLPGGSHISLPSVASGQDHRLIIPGSTLEVEVEMDCLGEPFRLGLHRRRE
ncbi:MAG: chemotaxis protein CheX [Myxococcota bacterium]